LFNLTSALSIIGFGLLFGLFLPTELVLLLIAAMSIYDVIGVFYTRHIKYIWLGRVGFNPRWRNTLGIVFPEGSHFSLVGSGDFALPLVLTASAATENLVGSVILAGFATVGFFALQSYASRTKKTKETGVPGIPILALFCALGVLLAKAAGLVG